MKTALLLLLPFCLGAQSLSMSDDSAKQTTSDVAGITLAATGLAMSVAALPSPFIAMRAHIADDSAGIVYGHGIGPGLSVCGGILSAIATARLRRLCDPYGSNSDLTTAHNRVKAFTMLGCAGIAVSTIGAIFFYSGMMTNDVTFTMSIPIGFAGGTFNTISAVKSLVTNIQYHRGMK